MRRTTAAVLGAIVGAGLLLAPMAGAEERPAREPREMALRCRDVTHRLGSPAAACGWHAVPADGYRLLRADRDGRAEPVFRTDDPRHTRHLDRTVVAGATYAYVVQAVGRDGRVVAQSPPVRVSIGGDEPRALRVPVRR